VNDVAVRVLQINTPQAVRAELERVGADLSLSGLLARAEFFWIKVERVSLALARFLYQELEIEGGQVVTPPRLEHVGEDETDALLCATRYQFNHLLVRLRWQPSEELQLLSDNLERALDQFTNPPPALVLRDTRFDWNARTYIMGILNLTPDSFSGDALMQSGDTEAQTIARAVARAKQLVNDGADLLDIGGESTRPHAVPVDAQTELQRVLPVVRALQNEIAVPLSIDTSKAKVADAALDAGALLVNDVSGMRDADMARVVAAHGAAVVLMHNRKLDALADTLRAVVDELRILDERAQDAGIAPSRILLDPGLGFGKSPAQNLELLNRVGELRAFGHAILIGPSRKGFISKAIGVPADERVEGTAAAIAIAIARGANMARVHDVKMMARIAHMTDAIQATGFKI
jgi:dihydropteroate synthase